MKYSFNMFANQVLGVERLIFALKIKPHDSTQRLFDETIH